MSPLLAKRLSDESLGSRLASGEAAAFDELYRRYVHRLAAYGAHLLGDGVAGDDVAQVTMLKAYGALRDGRQPDRMKPWLYRIAHNVAIDLVMRRREVPSAELPEVGAPDAEPVGGALVAALASLPERQRRVYVLRELHGLRIDETAAELSLTAAQVEQSLFAARNRLAEHLVFGDRLNCVAVQRLAAGPLDTDERRALKNHLRSCAGCRGGLGVRGRALSMLPVTSLDWLRGLVAGAAGGGAPVAAKVGAAVATVTVAAGVPVAVETAHNAHAHRARLPQQAHVVKTRVARPAAQLAATPAVSHPASHPVFVSRKAPAAISVPHRSGRGRSEKIATPAVQRVIATGDHRDNGGKGDHGDQGSGVSVVTGDSHEGHGGGDTPMSISSSDGSRSGHTEDNAERDNPAVPPVLTAPVASGSGDSGGDSNGSGGGGGGGGGSDSQGGGDGGGGGSSGGGGGGGGGDHGGNGDLPAPASGDSSVTD